MSLKAVLLAVICVVGTSCSSSSSSPEVSPDAPRESASSAPAPEPTPPPKNPGDLELEACDPLGLLPCEHQAVVVTEPVAGTGVSLTYSTEWADGRTDRPVWNAQALGLGGWSLDVLHRYDPDNGILLAGDGSWRPANAVDVGGGERAVPTLRARALVAPAATRPSARHFPEHLH